jgi:hypothetical protein
MKKNQKEKLKNNPTMIYYLVPAMNVMIMKLIKSGNLDAIKQYICSYYAKVVGLKNEVIFFDFDNDNNKFVYVSYNDFIRTKLKPITKQYSEYHKSRFDFIEWFNSLLIPEYNLKCEILKPKVFVENKKRYINLAGTHLHFHKTFKPLNSYPKDIQDKVQYIWNHIKKCGVLIKKINLNIFRIGFLILL